MRISQQRSALNSAILLVWNFGGIWRGYKVSHLENWSRYDVALFLVFQTVIVCSGLSLFYGYFQAAFIILAVFGGVLVLIGSIAKSLRHPLQGVTRGVV